MKFVFATTEIRKVPVTVLSRCQRFDLRRIETEQLIFHLSKIAGLESVTAEDEALALIARAAEGSVRDGLSLLDQAIALCGASIGTEDVRQMLGLADRARTIELLHRVLAGDIAAALEELKAQHDAGADPLVVVTDLAALVHWLTRLKLVPGAGEDISVPEDERARGTEMAGKLSMRVLTRAWQMLLKGVPEIRNAANPMAAADMVLVRLAYAADLPAPDELIRRLDNEPAASTPAPAASADAGNAAPQPSARAGEDTASPVQAQAAPAMEPQAEPVPVSEPEPQLPQPQSFEEVVALAAAQRDIKLKSALERGVRLVGFRPGHLDISLAQGTQASLVGDLTRKLAEWTGTRWIVSLSQDEGDKTLFEKTKEKQDAALEEAMRDPVVGAALKIFPDAEILSVRDTFEMELPPQTVDDEDGEPDY